MNRTLRSNAPAFDCYGTLDFIIFAILQTLGLDPERLVRDPERYNTTHDRIAYRNARRFANHYAAHPIPAIKAIREHSGMDLVSAKDAWNHILAAYEVEADYHRASVAKCLEDGNIGGADYHLRKFEQAVR